MALETRRVPMIDPETGRFPDKYTPQQVLDSEATAVGAAAAASGSATAAAGSEGAAATSAAEALASEGAALASEVAAQAAQTGAEAARSGAEIARSDAEAAQAASETARDDAAASASTATTKAAEAGVFADESDASKTLSSSSSVSAYESMTAAAGIKADVEALRDSIDWEKGAAGGVATLDGGGKVPLSQLPSALMELKGLWNASTNTPALTNGAGDPGDVYIVSTGGSRDLGAGAVTYSAGDFAVYLDGKWERVINSNAVASVNGYTGAVALTKNDVGLGNVNNTSDADKPVSTAVTAALGTTVDSLQISGRNLVLVKRDGSNSVVGTFVTDVTAGTVTTLAPGAVATASMSGTTTDKVLTLGIPKGTKGDAGDLTASDSATISGTVALPSAGPYTLRRALAANTTFTLSAGISNQAYTLSLRIVQDATGSRTITWPSVVMWPEGIKPQPSTAPNSVSLFHLFWDGYYWLGTKAGQNFA